MAGFGKEITVHCICSRLRWVSPNSTASQYRQENRISDTIQSHDVSVLQQMRVNDFSSDIDDVQTKLQSAVLRM